MSDTIASPPSKHSKLILLLILLVIIGPMLFAWVLVKRAEKHEFKQSNHGDLIPSPPNAAPILGKQFLGKWWLVYVGPQKCYEECQSTLYNLRQLQVALGKDSSRVERLFIAHPDCPSALCEVFLTENYPDLLRVKLKPLDFDKLFFVSSPERETLGEIYIIDPHGNVMMHYSPDIEPKGILSDLKRLLRVSKIG
jgi:cytochrome oxidase Cu insertion factor (SCO1/SenC/PrrC family)